MTFKQFADHVREGGKTNQPAGHLPEKDHGVQPVRRRCGSYHHQLDRSDQETDNKQRNQRSEANDQLDNQTFLSRLQHRHDIRRDGHSWSLPLVSPLKIGPRTRVTG